MNIQCKVADKNHQPDKRIHTNIGEFWSGEIRTVSPEQEEEAARLVENGDFVETDAAPNSNEIAKGMAKATEKWDASKAKAKKAEAKEPAPPTAAPRAEAALPPAKPAARPAPAKKK